MIRLVFAYLGERKLTVALNVLLLAISVGMLVLLLQFSRQAEERFLGGAENIDLVVGAKGSPLQLVLSSVYHLDQPTGNIPLEALGDVRFAAFAPEIVAGWVLLGEVGKITPVSGQRVARLDAAGGILAVPSRCARPEARSPAEHGSGSAAGRRCMCVAQLVSA